MSGHLKQKVGNTVTHSFVDPKDVVIEKVNDEYIVEIDCGYPTERTFTFQHIAIDMFINDDIVMGINNPDSLEPFFDVTELVIEYPKDQGIGAVEIHCAR